MAGSNAPIVVDLTGAAESNKDGAAPSSGWFKVLQHLHLGMNLRVGGTYSQEQLRRRCADIDKLAQLEAFLLKPEYLLPTEKPPSRPQKKLLKLRKLRKEPELRFLPQKGPTWYGPVQDKMYRRREGNLQASVGLGALQIRTLEIRNLLKADEAFAALKSMRLKAQRAFRASQKKGVSSFHEAVRKALQEVQDESQQQDVSLSFSPPFWRFYFLVRINGQTLRTTQTHDVDTAFRSWRRLAKDHNIKEDFKSALLPQKFAVHILRKRKEADSAAGALLAELKDDLPTREQVLPILRLWGFRKNVSRVNVIPDDKKYVYSDSVGILKQKGAHNMVLGKGSHMTNFLKLLCRWRKGEASRSGIAHLPPFTSLNINKNYAAKRHRDAGNVGPSTLLSVGDFTGGRLRYFPSDPGNVDLGDLKAADAKVFEMAKLIQFDGRRAHEVEPFTGERYSVVFFISKGYQRAEASDREHLTETAGFTWPSAGFSECPHRFRCKRPPANASRTRPSAKRARGERAGDIPEGPHRWFRVVDLPNLGLNLAVGQVYCDWDLQRRCMKDSLRLQALSKKLVEATQKRRGKASACGCFVQVQGPTSGPWRLRDQDSKNEVAARLEQPCASQVQTSGHPAEPYVYVRAAPKEKQVASRAKSRARSSA